MRQVEPSNALVGNSRPHHSLGITPPTVYTTLLAAAIEALEARETGAAVSLNVSARPRSGRYGGVDLKTHRPQQTSSPSPPPRRLMVMGS